MPEDNTSTQDAPVDEVINEPTQTEEVTETQEVTEAPEQIETVTQEEQVTEPEDEEDDGYVPYVPPQDVQVPQLDLNAIPLDADGNYDASALAQAINNQLAAANQEARKAQNLVLEMEEKRKEEQLWQKAQEKFPELKDKQLAQEVNALRFGILFNEVNEGKADAKLMTPAKTFERLRTRFQTERAEGTKTALESVRVQESAYVEPTQNAQSASTSTEDALFEKMRYADRATAEQAQRDLLKQRLFGN